MYGRVAKTTFGTFRGHSNLFISLSFLFVENAEDLHWKVQRQYSEFYALESKLTEFHGEFEDVRLPAENLVGSENGRIVGFELGCRDGLLDG